MYKSSAPDIRSPPQWCPELGRLFNANPADKNRSGTGRAPFVPPQAAARCQEQVTGASLMQSDRSPI